jgi:hypothetical protein
MKTTTYKLSYFWRALGLRLYVEALKDISKLSSSSEPKLEL